MDGQAGKSLRGALGEADVGEGRLAGDLENVADAIRNIVEGKLVNGKVPKLGRRGGISDRLFRILVAPVVSELEI